MNRNASRTEIQIRHKSTSKLSWLLKSKNKDLDLSRGGNAHEFQINPCCIGGDPKKDLTLCVYLSLYAGGDCVDRGQSAGQAGEEPGRCNRDQNVQK